MSFDNAIASLITALNANTEALRAHAAQMGQPVQHVQVATPAVVVPVQQPAPAASFMPAAPTFTAPTFAAPGPAAAPTAPFSTQQQLFEYTGAAYQAMGPEKGGKIQGILTGMGIDNLNKLEPAAYGTFFAQVEALKASA